MSYWHSDIGFETLKGKTIVAIHKNDSNYEDRITFETSDGAEYLMFHSQDCCESVTIEEIVGDLNDLVNDGPVLLAEEVVDTGNSEYGYDSTTWTFYKLRTQNGDVTIRWLGSSNGYYSESVTFSETRKPNAETVQ